PAPEQVAIGGSVGPTERFRVQHPSRVDYRWDDAVASKIGDDLDQLLYFGRLIGGDPSLFQAGGGGLSLKRRERDFAGREIDVLWVKGTGASLLHMGRGQLTP